MGGGKDTDFAPMLPLKLEVKCVHKKALERDSVHWSGWFSGTGGGVDLTWRFLLCVSLGSQQRLCNLLLNSSFKVQIKWQMYGSLFFPGFFHGVDDLSKWLSGALLGCVKTKRELTPALENEGSGGPRGGRASRAQKCRPQRNRWPEKEPCLLWIDSKELLSDNGSFSVPVNEPLTEERKLCFVPVPSQKQKRASSFFLLFLSFCGIRNSVGDYCRNQNQMHATLLCYECCISILTWTNHICG